MRLFCLLLSIISLSWAQSCVVYDQHGLCVTCPVGAYPDATLQDCELCPLGFYQDQYRFNGSSCIECPLHEYLQARHTTISTGAESSKACILVLPNYSVLVTFLILAAFVILVVGYFWWKEGFFPHFPLRVFNVIFVPIIYFVCSATYLHWIDEMEATGEPVYDHDVFAVGAAIIIVTSIYWAFFLFFFCIAACGKANPNPNDTKVKCGLPTCACAMLPILCIIRDFVALVGSGHVLQAHAHEPIELLNTAEVDTGIPIDAPHITNYRLFDSALLVSLSIILIISELIWLHYDWNLGLSIDRIIHIRKKPNVPEKKGRTRVSTEEQ